MQTSERGLEISKRIRPADAQIIKPRVAKS